MSKGARLRAQRAAQIVPRVISIPALEAEARANLSNYGGLDDLADYGGVDYAAEINAYGGDDLVDYDGDKASFDELNMLQTERIYKFKVTNGVASDASFYLSAALLIDKIDVIGSAAIGLPVKDGVFKSIENTDLTITGNTAPFNQFRNWFMQNATRVMGLKVSSDDSSQMETSIFLKRYSPFKELQSRTVYLSNYQNENTFQDKQVTVPERFQLDDQQLVKLSIVASSSMTITLYCGAVINPAKGLLKKAGREMQEVVSRNGLFNLKRKQLQVGGLVPQGGQGAAV